MNQHTGGIHSLLSSPWAYRTYQRAIGSRHLHRTVLNHLRARPGDRMLDIGCGPAEVLDVLTGVEYIGFDLSERYVEHARSRYGGRAKFFVATVSEVDAEELGHFDVVLAHGILHHLSDHDAAQVFALARDVLTPSGRLVTVDGCFDDGQSRLARALLARDRGQMVRTASEYRALAEPAFARIDVHIEHALLRIPYTLAILTCEEPRSLSRGQTDAESKSTAPIRPGETTDVR